MGKLAKHCYKCGYIGKVAGTVCCEYCVLTGRIRGSKRDENGILRPISASECTHWKDTKRGKQKPQQPMEDIIKKETETAVRLRIMHTQIEKLYSAGLNDREIAEKLRCSKTTVRRWRMRNGIQSQVKAHRFIEKGGTS